MYKRQSKGCWVGEISLGFSASGRRLRRKVYGASKREVQHALRKAQKEAEAGVTVADAVRKWMASPGVRKLAPKTRDKFRTLADNHLLPQIGKAKLRDLTADDVEEWLEGRASILARRTLRELLPVLRRSINLALWAKLVEHNVAELTEIPTGSQPSRK